MKLKKGLVIPIVLIFVTSIILLSVVEQSTTFAQTTSTETSNSVNDVSLRTVFNFKVGIEEITTFQVFNQLGGYERTGSPSFELHGIIDGSKQLLHEATHAFYHEPSGRHKYDEFDVNIYLSDGAATNTHFIYNDCDIKDYFMETLYDKEETYNGKTKFAHVEHYEIECAGYHPLHPVETQVTSDGSKIPSSIDKEEPLTWEDFYR